jgi:hypothetical protein
MIRNLPQMILWVRRDGPMTRWSSFDQLYEPPKGPGIARDLTSSGCESGIMGVGVQHNVAMPLQALCTDGDGCRQTSVAGTSVVGQACWSRANNAQGVCMP